MEVLVRWSVCVCVCDGRGGVLWNRGGEMAHEEVMYLYIIFHNCGGSCPLCTYLLASYFSFSFSFPNLFFSPQLGSDFVG